MLYLVRRNQSNSTWRVLMIDRCKPTELSITDNSHPYTAVECVDLLRKIREENKESGGLKLVTNCYGIIGFVKFNGPFYMLLITRRSKIGTILGHDVYSVDKSEIIKIPPGLPEMANLEDEKRQLECLRSVDLSKGFFFSYTYNLAQTVQCNITEKNTLESLNSTTFVWNDSLTKSFKSPIWTVSLVHGFFIQKKVSVSAKDFQLTIVARRSRHLAGRRFLKRGVNEEGMVANDVETEQIVFEETEDGIPPQITSVVQRRGSIPLSWSQKISKCPILSKMDESYNATCLHFENLKTTYGGQIIVLNLIKSFEKEPRESPLHFAFEQAIHHINNKCLSAHDQILFVHMDVKNYSRSHEVLPVLVSIGSEALRQTNILHCQLTPVSNSKDNNSGHCDVINSTSNANVKDPHFSTISVQKGVLRTNCLDCLDRTNSAQFAYGLASLSLQLRSLGLAESDEISINDHLSYILMDLYEQMGDELSMQYTGSAALNKVFWKHRGKCGVVSQVQGFFRSIQRFLNNAFMDGKKQDALDLFLGYFHSQQEQRSMMEREEAMNKSLNVNQEHPICQSSSSVVNSSTTTLDEAEVQNHSNQPRCTELFHSNFLVLDEGSNAVKSREETVS
ncbi:phosphoinositide phosphatase SAC2-like [Miscanthus floridulus]|uniref:phosphoinositide phosphatase SAC2-like n=1 Tax=Miscanthus floridulus TaxID=154761 RepID=UPI00345762BE